MILKKVLNELGIKRYYRRQRNEKTFYIPIFNSIGFANFVNSEPWMDALLMKLGSNETKILDVGVNVGQTIARIM